MKQAVGVAAIVWVGLISQVRAQHTQPEVVYGTEPEQIEKNKPKSLVGENQLLFAGHLTVVGPVGPFALEVGADLANWVSVRAIAGYVDEDYEHFGIADSYLEGAQVGGFVTARIPLRNWTIRPGFGLSVGSFDGEMLYDLDDHPWADPETGPLFSDYNDSCVFGCNEAVKLDGVLWAHLEVGGQVRLHEGFFVRGYAGVSMGLVGWGLQECAECTEQERDDKSGEIFGHTVDPYGGVALGWAINLRP